MDFAWPTSPSQGSAGFSPPQASFGTDPLFFDLVFRGDFFVSRVLYVVYSEHLGCRQFLKMASLQQILRDLYKGLPEKEIMEELSHKCIHHHKFTHELHLEKDKDRWTMLHWGVQNCYYELCCYVLAIG